MPAVPYSYRQYGTVGASSFAVPFPYLLKAHVKVYLGYNLLTGTFTSELVDGVGFTWTSGTQIGTTAALTTGQVLTVIRQTPSDTRLVDWSDGSKLTADDLDTADLQTLYVVQEQQDRNDLFTTQQNANVLLKDGSVAMTANFNAGNNRVINLAAPTADTDAVNRGYVNTIVAKGIGDGDKGDIVVSGDGSVLSIDAGAIVDADVNASAAIASSKLAFTQAGAASPRSGGVEAKLKDVVSVKDFGAVGNGIVNDTAAVQAAFNALANGGTISFPRATYKITDSIDIGVGNISIVGNDSTIDATAMTVLAQRGEAVFRFVRPSADVTTTLASSAAAGAVQLTVTSAAGMAVGDLIRCLSDKVQYRNATALAYYNDQNIIKAISGNTVTLEHPLAYALDISSNAVSITVVRPIQNLKVSGLKFLGAGEYFANPGGTGGASQMGLYFYGCRNVTARDCSFTGFQGASIWCEYANNVDISHCYFEGYNQSVAPNSNTAFYAAYVSRGRNARVTQCSCLRVRHMCDSAEWYDYLQANNTAQSTHLAAFGSHEETYNVTIANNISYDCYAGTVRRALTGIVTGNTFFGGPLTVAGVSTMVMSSADPEQAEFIIANNRIQDSGGFAIILNLATKYLQIANNYLQGSVTFNDGSYLNVTIQGNTIHGVLAFASDTTKPTLGLFIQGNTFTRFGSNITPIAIRGCTDISTPSDYIMIADNITYTSAGDNSNGAIILRSAGYYGDSIVIKNNAQWGDISAEITIQSGTNLKSWPVVEQNENGTASSVRRPRPIWIGTSSTPSELANATVLKNSIIVNSSVSAAGAHSWQVTSPGSYGTITGVTGSIDAGEITLTLAGNNATKVYPGCIIGITGSGLTRVRVASLSSDFVTATLEAPASTTVTGATVTRTAPILNAVNLA